MISTLLEKIKEIDLQWFVGIREGLKNPFLDKWMPIVTDVDNWIWLLIIGWLGLLLFGGRKGRLVCLILVLVVLFADNLNSYILKPFFGRERPLVMLGISSSKTFSFPSNHAVNSFAIASVLSWYYRKLSIIWFLVAFIVGFSRVYVGQHFPLDIAAAIFVGAICAFICISLVSYLEKKLFNKAKPA